MHIQNNSEKYHKWYLVHVEFCNSFYCFSYLHTVFLLPFKCKHFEQSINYSRTPKLCSINKYYFTSFFLK